MGDLYMVNDFLKKYQEELITEKIQLKEDIDLLETKIKEETKFLALLEESNESYFKEFTPRDINEKNNKKAAEVRENLKDLNSHMDELLTRMKFYDGRIIELTSLISNSVVINKPNSNLKSTDSSSKVNAGLIDSLESIKNLVVLDPYKAKIELENLILSIKKD
jgi:hypothetical protein